MADRRSPRRPGYHQNNSSLPKNKARRSTRSTAPPSEASASGGEVDPYQFVREIIDLCTDSDLPLPPHLLLALDNVHRNTNSSNTHDNLLMANFSGDADDVDQPDGAGDVTVLHGSGRKQRGGVHRSRSRKKRRESIFDVLVNEKEMMRSSTDLVTGQSQDLHGPAPIRRQTMGRRKSLFDNLGLKKGMSAFIDEVRYLSDENKEVSSRINLSFPKLEIRLIGVGYTVIKSSRVDEIGSSPGSTFSTFDSPPGMEVDPTVRGAKPSVLRQNMNNVARKIEDTYQYMKHRASNPVSGPVKFEKIPQQILRDVNLRFVSGKMYLVLGGACSGKSTLLKAIAGTLREDRSHIFQGDISINNINRRDTKNLNWSNLVTFVDNQDVHLNRLTVEETVEFAWKCKSGGTHRASGTPDTPEVNEYVAKLDAEKWRVSRVLKGLGLDEVKNSIVGDENTRGVSGGERKRVTISELLSISTPIVCIDELSTGLDAATTFDIVRLLSETVGDNNAIYIVSLLQPPPETFALFDECIVLDRGSVIYAGIVRDVLHHFHEIGYQLPPRMDLAEWLQCICQPDGGKYRTRKKTLNAHISDVLDKIEEWDISSDEEDINTRTSVTSANRASIPMKHLSNDDFVDAFMYSHRGTKLMDSILNPFTDEVASIEQKPEFVNRYQNPNWQSLKFVIEREWIQLWRGKKLLKARIIQNLIMAFIVGIFFYDAGNKQGDLEDEQDGEQMLVAVYFHSARYIALNAARDVIPQLGISAVIQKQHNCNFLPMFTYVLGRSIALVPLFFIDAFLYGLVTYPLCAMGAGLSTSARMGNFFVYVFLLWQSGYTVHTLLGIFTSYIRSDMTVAIAIMAVVFFIHVLTSGYTVQYDSINENLKFLYWANYMAWTLRAMVLNEFEGGAEKYKIMVPNTDTTRGEAILERFGYSFRGSTFTHEWIWYSILFCTALNVISIFAASYILEHVNHHTPVVTTSGNNEFLYLFDDDWYDDQNSLELPFQTVTLTFKDIRYSVITRNDASAESRGEHRSIGTNSTELVILKNVTGYVAEGKMTALMGSSGAGKTSLMDVLSLRRKSGTVTGEIRVNGHLMTQHFRRCTGYVEQFDTQSPQLTVRETVRFSAKLRLDESEFNVTPSNIERFVDQTLEMLELTLLEHHLVGSKKSGLTMEQRKRLSIAVELVANPSIIFLDEPTSGLDSRGANIVMRCLKRIAKSGRAVCATIHQPSISIFNSFDSLLLLRRGGRVVYFGDIGRESESLIKYLESFEETPKILEGENPATWMLTSITAKSSDYVRKYQNSYPYRQCLEVINEAKANANENNRIYFSTKYAASLTTQSIVVVKRMMKIYSRSPSYNVGRIVQAAVVALSLGLMFANKSVPDNEGDMTSRVNSIYIAVVFIMTTSFDNVLPLFEVERNMFYRHQENVAYNPITLINALLVSELPFIIQATFVFCTCFYFFMGFTVDITRIFFFYLFFGINMSMWTFLGQAFISMFKKLTTAQGYGGMLVTLSIMLAGVLIYPQNIPDGLKYVYWLIPSHYVIEGILVSQYDEDTTEITPTLGSPFYRYVCGLESCAISCEVEPDTTCFGTAAEWINVTFGGKFTADHMGWNLLYLTVVMTIARILTFFALVNVNHFKK